MINFVAKLLKIDLYEESCHLFLNLLSILASFTVVNIWNEYIEDKTWSVFIKIVKKYNSSCIENW